MSTWRFDKESNTDYQGANTVAGQLAGHQPHFQADTLSSKRNVIATEKGWIRRTHKNTDGNQRQIDEVLVAAHPGSAGATGGYSGIAYLGFPDIAQVYLNSTSISAAYGGENVSVYVVMNEPVKHSGAAGSLQITVANTAGGNSSLVATATAVNSNTGITNANNTLVFTLPVTAGDAGSYKIQAQTVINATSTAANLVSLNAGSESANLVITGAVSNTVGTIVITAA
jgi:hypothetical protein